jgi:hypothetical protein
MIARLRVEQDFNSLWVDFVGICGKVNYAERVGAGAPIYLAAILEYLAA